MSLEWVGFSDSGVPMVLESFGSSSGATMILYDLRTGAEIGRFDSTPPPLSAEVSPDGLHVVTHTYESRDDGITLLIRTWEIKAGQELPPIKIPRRSIGVSFISRDGRMMVVRIPLWSLTSAHSLGYGWPLAWSLVCCGGYDREF